MKHSGQVPQASSFTLCPRGSPPLLFWRRTKTIQWPVNLSEGTLARFELDEEEEELSSLFCSSHAVGGWKMTRESIWGACDKRVSRSFRGLEIRHPVPFSTPASSAPSFASGASNRQVGIKHPRENYSKLQFKNEMSVIKERFLILKLKPRHVLNAWRNRQKKAEH